MASAASPALVSWTHAFPVLPVLASSAMAQPAGRLLGVTATNSVWLRASPILCALDALSLLVRVLACCLLLRATPRQALVLLGDERFEPATEPQQPTALPTADPDDPGDPSQHERGTTLRAAATTRFAAATAARLAGFGAGIVLLAELQWFAPGGHEARWTAAWAWMFVASYAVLEAAAQVYRRERARPQYTAADFELDEAVGGDTARNSLDSDSDSHDGSHDGSHGGSHDTAGLLASAASTAAASAARDVEADKVHPHEYSSGPASHPRRPAVTAALGKMDLVLLGVGSAAHGAFLYWAFLDLVQPAINRHMLAVDARWVVVTGWNTTLFYMSMPVSFVFLFLGIITALGAGVVVATLLVFAGKLANHLLPASVTGCAGGAVATAISGTTLAAGVLAVLFFFSESSIFSDVLLSNHMYWVYGMLAVETVLLFLFLGGCLVFYAAVKGAAVVFNGRCKGAGGATTLNGPGGPGGSEGSEGSEGSVWAAARRRAVRRVRQYTGEDSVALAFLALLTLLLVLIWYAVRFVDAGHWAQDWRDALVGHVASNSSSSGNATASGALASATSSMATAAARAAPVRLV